MTERREREEGGGGCCFDRWADDYDRTFISPYLRKIQKQVVRLMAPTRGASVIDVGCGTGEAIRYLRRSVKGGLLAGLDLSPRMIETARRKFGEAPGVEWRVGDAECIPWPDSTFDLAMATFTIHHCLHPEQALAEIRRVLRPGGRFFLVELIFPPLLRRPMNWILGLAERAPLQIQTHRSTRSSLQRSGLRLCTCQRLAPFIFLFISQKEPSAVEAEGGGKGNSFT